MTRRGGWCRSETGHLFPRSPEIAVHEAGEVVVDRDRPHADGDAFAFGLAAGAAAHENPQATGARRCLEVVEPIADERRPGRMGPETPHGVEQHARPRLVRRRAAIVVGTAQNQIEASAEPLEPLAQILMDGVELASVDDAAPNLGLVGTDGDPYAGPAQPDNRIGRAGNELQLGRTLDVELARDVDDAVAVEQHQFHVAIRQTAGTAPMFRGTGQTSRAFQRQTGGAMSFSEQVKKAAEQAIGIGRPSSDELVTLVNRRAPQRHHFEGDGKTPNNPRLPLLHYRDVLRSLDGLDPAALCEALFAAHGWAGSWRNGIYPFLHFHTATHEVLGIARGSAHVQFGGDRGKTL